MDKLTGLQKTFFSRMVLYGYYFSLFFFLFFSFVPQRLNAQEDRAVTLIFAFPEYGDNHIKAQVLLFNQEFLTIQGGETISKLYRPTEGYVSIQYRYIDKNNPDNQSEGDRFSWTFSERREYTFEIPKPAIAPSGLARILFKNSFMERISLRLTNQTTGIRGQIGDFNKTEQGWDLKKPSTIDERAEYLLPAGRYKIEVLNVRNEPLRTYEEFYLPPASYTLELSRDAYKVNGYYIKPDPPVPVPVASEFLIRFSKPMIKPIVEQYVKLYRSDDPKRISVPVKTDWKDDDRLLIIKPEAHLSPSSRYCLSIENLNARDRFGNALAEAIQEEFLTGNTIPSLQKAQHVQYDSVSKTLSWDGVPGADGYELWLFYGNEKERHDRNTAQHHTLTPSNYPSPTIDCLVLPYKNFSGDVKGYSEEAVNSKPTSILFRSSRPMVLGLQILGDPHLQKQVELALRKILGEQRYVTTANREAYMLVGEISAWEQSSPAFGSHPPLNGVRSGISLQLVNSEGVSIFSYANNYAIHRALDWNRAYSDAFKEIEHDLKTVFIPRFNAFLGN